MQNLTALLDSYVTTYEHAGYTASAEVIKNAKSLIVAAAGENAAGKLGKAVPQIDLCWPRLYLVRYPGSLDCSLVIVSVASFEEGVARIEADSGCSVEDGSIIVKELETITPWQVDFEVPLRCVANTCAAGDSKLADQIAILEFVREQFEDDGPSVHGQLRLTSESCSGSSTIQRVLKAAYPAFAELVDEWEGEDTPDVDRVVAALRRDAAGEP